MMKRQYVALTALLATIVAVALPVKAVAQTDTATVYDDVTNVSGMSDRTGRSDVGLQLAGGFSDDNIDNAFYVGASYSRGISPWLAWGFEAGWQEADFDLSNDEDLAMVTAFGDIIGRVNVADWAAVPYGVVGAGVLHAYTDATSDDDDETAFAMKFGIGLDWFLNANWILNVEASYIATGGEINSGIANTEDLDHWRVGGGFKFVF